MPKRKLDDGNNKNMETSSLGKKSKLADSAEKNTEYQAACAANIICSNKNIKLVLKDYLPSKNIEEVYLFQVTGDHIYYDIINKLKSKLIDEITDKVIAHDKFYIIIGLSVNSNSQVSFAILLKLYSKDNTNQIKIFPIVTNIKSNEDLLLGSELKRESALVERRIKIRVSDVADWFQAHQGTNIYLNNLLEVIRLSIAYKSLSKVPEDKIKEIMDTPYTEYEKLHQELLNRLKLTDGEQIEELNVIDKQAEMAASTTVKKTVFWKPEVKDNEGRTIREKNPNSKIKAKGSKKAKDEVKKYFEECITSWEWDKKIWDEKYFNTNKISVDRFQYLLDQYSDRFRGKFGGHILKKHRYDCPDDYQGYDRVTEGSINKIIEGYIFLISYSPNLLKLLKQSQGSTPNAFFCSDDSILSFYNAHPELKLINLIEKSMANVTIAKEDQANISITSGYEGNSSTLKY